MFVPFKNVILFFSLLFLTLSEYFKVINDFCRKLNEVIFLQNGPISWHLAFTIIKNDNLEIIFPTKNRYRGLLEGRKSVIIVI